MATHVITGTDELKSLVGEHLGYSDYMEITQDRVNQFADATGDHQWIHVDVERAKAGPFGGPIAHGYLTLSLGPVLYPTIVRIEGFSMGVNYGANKVRFPAPVPVGARLRLGVKLLASRTSPVACRRRWSSPSSARAPASRPASPRSSSAATSSPSPSPSTRPDQRLRTRLRYPQPSTQRPGPAERPAFAHPVALSATQRANAVPPTTSGHRRSAELGDDLRRRQLEGLGVGVVGVPGDEAGAAEGHIAAGSSRPPGPACRRGCRPATRRTARCAGCGSRRRSISASVSRTNTSGDHVLRISS